MSILDTRNSAAFAGVFVQTNELGTNRVLAFRRAQDGALEPAGEYATGGVGLGAVHLGSQGSVIFTADGRFLLVTNAGSTTSRCSLCATTGWNWSGQLRVAASAR